jgi:hypothetical protein
MSVKLQQEKNQSGDVGMADQGFGRMALVDPPIFSPVEERKKAVEFFSDNGYVVLSDCLSRNELDHLNEFCNRTQKESPERWGLGESRTGYHEAQGLAYPQPLLDHPELDPYTQHPKSYPIVCDLLGGEDRPRFSEFNLREVPENAGVGTMNFHHDKVLPARKRREPYMPCDYLSVIHYLSDVKPGTPTFCVVPHSRRYDTLKEAYDELGDDYWETPIYAPAGSCVIFDSATFHTRYDGDGKHGRRTWHQYYARGGYVESYGPVAGKYMRAPSPVLTDWNLFPERLALHQDPNKRRFYSHWNTAQGEWVASGFSEELRRKMPVLE